MMVVDARRKYQRPEVSRRGEKLFHDKKRQRSLSDLQAKVLSFMRGKFELTSVLPSLTVMSRRFGLTATSVVAVLLGLKRKGYLKMDGRRTQTMELTDKL